MLSADAAKQILNEVDLDTTPWYNQSRGLKFLWYPVFPTEWSEIFVLFAGGDKAGLAVLLHGRFAVYCTDKAVMDAFLADIPAVWTGQECVESVLI